jgi:DNA mismatch repair ATPase MutS
MTREQLQDLYSHRSLQFQTAVNHHQRLMGLLSLLRLLSLSLAVFLLVMGIRQQHALFYVSAGVMVGVFFLLVVRYNRRKDLKELNGRLKELNRRESLCLDHQFQSDPDGSEFSDRSHPWSYDLDLFGKGSLYQYLNRTATRQGSALLAGMLTREPEHAGVITDRQAIIGELRDRIDFRQTLTARGQMIPEKAGDLDGIARWLTMPVYILRHRWLFYLALGISALSLGIMSYGFLDPSGFWYLLPLLLINFTILSPFLQRTNRYQQDISRKHELLEGYARLLEIIAAAELSHPELAQAGKKAREGMKEVVRLSRLLNVFDQRLNMLLGVVFNGFFLFDFIMLHLLEQWKGRNRDRIMEWIGVTGRMDALISLAGFAFNHPAYALPDLSGTGDCLDVKDLGHPLIPPGKRVDNDLLIEEEKVVIITGANMAGKSTFLRALGVNLVLAYTGCPVCASRFRVGFMGLFTSMRTSDSLAEEESYFLAEIRRLQRIVQRIETGPAMMVLLDELLKGTNTTDKKLGSVGMIRRILPCPVRCFIATHDLSLGELEKELPGEVAALCFESYIDGLELSFDYTIRKGIATNMNASFLMKHMGIMDE